MPKVCVQAVQNAGRSRGISHYLPTWSDIVAKVGVYSPRDCAQQSPQVLPLAVHKMCSVFTSVMTQLIPTIHSTYNKQLRII